MTQQDLVKGFLAGLIDHDFDRMRAVLAPTATWSVPGRTGISGVAEGADAVVERAQAVAAGGVSIELQYLLEGWDRVAVLLHNTGRRGEAALDEQVVIVFSVDGDQITAAENLISDVPMLEAFFRASAQA
ncbi:nuclear transport factor 2 family protein [Actinomycetospora endophytica]|uniref:Nuclear transport factor 2 family protein n=1 Tax=Actinomycetospora endophytica TaxID=2291215 RepID=A0ABS8P1F4_9PSEU|nr:nuclear transport factor 2 family protein [Actinomycetospora endophytica]MCD2192066.1 nuclear transport factor 2 family protein [Actinomycetospora endophytica]